MKINKLIIENFKGVRARQEFELKPITIFFGPNSSGKSSCLHALAALSQTMKLSNSQLPIVLDDEYAQVHLGRFTDIIHSKSVNHSFKLGIGLNEIAYAISLDGSPPKARPPLEIEMEFKAKGAAQEIYVHAARVTLGKITYALTRNGDEFTAKRGNRKLPFGMITHGKFGYRPKSMFEKNEKLENALMQAFFVGEMVDKNLSESLRKVLYLGPFRQGPLRRYPTRGSQPTEVGASGEAAVPMLANEFSRSENKHPNISKISKWLKEMKLGKRLVISPVSNTDLFDINLSLEDGESLALPDLGYGISQVLPVLVQCSFAPQGATLLFEQPELHLHERASRRLGGVFAEVAKTKNLTIVAETHSKHLVFEILNKIKTGALKVNDVALYEVCRRNGKSDFTKVVIEEDEGDIWIEHSWFNEMDK